MDGLHNSAHRWAIYGALFGAAFPIMAFLIRVAQLGSSGALAVELSDPLMWIIATAPAFLGGFAWLGGRQQDRVADLNASLEATVEKRTAALAIARDEAAARLADYNSLLSGLSEAFVAIGPDGRFTSLRSKAFSDLLPSASFMESATEFLVGIAGYGFEEAEAWMDSLWGADAFSGLDAVTERASGRVFTVKEQRGTLHARLGFRPLFGADGQIAAFLMTVTDVTEEIRATQEAARNTHRLQRVALAARDPATFEQFCERTDAAFARVRQPASRAELTTRLGRLRMHLREFAFVEVADAAERLGRQLVAPESAHEGMASYLRAVEALQHLWHSDRQDLREVLNYQGDPRPALSLRA